MKARNSSNAIRSLSLPDGSSTSHPLEMSAIAVRHFQAILAPPRLVFSPLPLNWVQDLTSYHCSSGLKASMASIPSASEIFDVIHKLNPNKAPGPDGLTSGFYKSAWGIVGQELLTSISTFFSTGFLPQAVNATILSLIPKKPGATLISDYRPISCCNTIYKVISKLLVARLKPILPDLILPNQTAFIKGRLLVENTLLASELVNGYHKNAGPPRLTIKVDLAKAFDTVNWYFILNCLRGFQVPESYLRWLQACICTPSFSVGFNGSIHGYFKAKRGLRQGDPLSPYLFVIAMNCLSLLLNKAAMDGQLGYHPKCEATGITHLCFADDLLIFTDGTLDSVTTIMRILQEFKALSGLGINTSKTSFFASGVTSATIDTITAATGITQAHLPVQYLGLPLCSKKLSLLDCAPLLQKIKVRVESWSVKSLSYAGRLQLLQSVVYGITNFWTTAFILPKACITKINSICNSFLWKGQLSARYTPRVGWASVTMSKEEGGLNLRDLVTWNKACTIKLIWLIFFRSNSLWVAWYVNSVLAGNVHKFWTARKNQKHSWLSNKLLKWRTIAYPWIRLVVGNGRNCRFWTSHWSPLGNLLTTLSSDSPLSTGIPLNTTLHDLWSPNGWILPPTRSDSLVTIQAHLSTLQLSDREDYYLWKTTDSTNSNFSLGELYNLLKQHKPLDAWSKVVWCSGSIPRHRFLTWLFVWNRSPTRDRIISWGLTCDPLCLLCSMEAESRNHIFFDCDFSWSVWSPIASRLNIPLIRSWPLLLEFLQNLPHTNHRSRLTIIAWQATVYLLWTERNHRLHRQISTTVNSILARIDSTVRNRASSLRESRPRFSSQILQAWFQGSPLIPP